MEQEALSLVRNYATRVAIAAANHLNFACSSSLVDSYNNVSLRFAVLHVPGGTTGVVQRADPQPAAVSTCGVFWRAGGAE